MKASRPYLLDVNLLIALAWPSHIHHELAQTWFRRGRRSGFRTCPVTQAGFVRISSNPKFTSAAVAPVDALALLDRITNLPEHEFWPDDVSLQDALSKIRPLVAAHRQVTDAYLAGLARAHGGILATLDRGAAVLSSSVELVGIAHH
jgi:toxin-antitoxin system PIN domain toxin